MRFDTSLQVDAVSIPVTWPVSPSDDPVAAIVATFADALSRPGMTYRVVAVPHVLTTTGVALPLAQLATLAHKHGALFVVDGAQAPGGLNVNVTATGADVYACSAHKWYVRPNQMLPRNVFCCLHSSLLSFVTFFLVFFLSFFLLLFLCTGCCLRKPRRC
jgi:hypothetical protein